MFYWKGKTQNGLSLTDELLSCDSLITVYIATAFISADGVDILRQLAEKHNLSKQNITLYLSEQFSSNKPGEMLEQLSRLCSVNILLGHDFHSKVYLLMGAENKLIYGSSNLTTGGFSKNIEFNCIETPVFVKIKIQQMVTKNTAPRKRKKWTSQHQTKYMLS